jgi:hypothetical protein
MNMPGDQYAPWVSADGKWMYFSRIRIVEHGRSTYRSRWEGEYFGEPEWLDYPVCLTGRYSFNDCPSLTPDGSRLYFASNRPDSNYQGQYIWYSDYINVVEEEPEQNVFELEVFPASREETTISYSIPESQVVFCGVFDTVGNLVRILVNTNQKGGEQRILWDGLDDQGRQVPAGTYFVQLTVDRNQTTRKTIYLK